VAVRVALIVAPIEAVEGIPSKKRSDKGFSIRRGKRVRSSSRAARRSTSDFASLYQTLPPYQQREGIRLVIANVKISEDALEISIHGRPAPEEVLEKLRAPGMHSPRRSETSIWLPGVMAQRASLRDQTPLSVEKRRSNRTVYVLRSCSRAA
jgi:hypothetical protein